MKIFKQLLFLLTIKERKQALLLMIMILIMALLDTIGVASIVPFVAVLTNPTLIETNLILSTFFEASTKIGMENNQEFLFFLGTLVFLILIISIFFKALTTYMQVRFAMMHEHSLGKRLVEGYLNQPYSWFLNRNSAELGKNILSDVSQVIGYGIRPFIELIAKSMVAVGLIALLIFVDPKLSFIIGLSLGGTYSFVFYSVRKKIELLGKKRLKNNELRFLAVNESFGAAKEIKAGGLEKIYTESFSKPAFIFAKTNAFAIILALLPRYVLEVIAFGGILLLILYMMMQSSDFNSFLPILSLYIFAGYRLMPALQEIYSSVVQLTFVSPALEKLSNDLKELNLQNINQKKEEVLTFKKNITLNKVNYHYPNSSRAALKNISINIPAKTKVGFIGPTGSGKTTVVDIILGLLIPQNGTLEIDGKVVTNKNLRSWQRSIGYVPQNIFLTDDTIASNIAFGVEQKNIDQEAVEKAAKTANLHEFVMNELPQKYQSVIGERGVRLSGGQRQRIGIARALYCNPKVLVLDEATSALDNSTELEVMDAINNLGNDITIILIAHRLNTVKKCDIIFKLEKGNLIDKGIFDEVVNSKKNF
jgi:ATP-binding cassette, subfamily B, bacterial PglK